MFEQMTNAVVWWGQSPGQQMFQKLAESIYTLVVGSESHGIPYGQCCRATFSGSTSPVANIPPYHSTAPHRTLETSTKGQPRAGPFSPLQNTREQCPKQTQNNTRRIFVLPRLQLNLYLLTSVGNTHVEIHNHK